ncbi:MAG TPA: cytochrome c oxidase assembly protein [Planktothrix sp.]|jgi:cytochrome c oxidase assembly factor CtaG
MTPWKLFCTAWEFSPSVVVGCALLLAVYFYAERGKPTRKAVNFTLGVLTIFFALVSPIDTLGDDYLFSAHMVQHMMLGMVAPVLLVAGIPESMARAWLKVPLLARLEKILGNPWLAVILANATFWIWHLPALYNLTLENETVHVIEHMMLMITGTMLWWPVFKPIAEGRLKPMAAIVYMFVAAIPSTALGIIFTMADTPYYSGYAHPDDDLGALRMIREDWGLSQIADQKLGGAIMWEPAGAIYLWAIMVVLVEWFREDNLVMGKPENV